MSLDSKEYLDDTNSFMKCFQV